MAGLIQKAKAVDPNKAIRIARASAYPIYIWYTIVAIVGLLGVYYWTRQLVTYLTSDTSLSHPRRPSLDQEKESGSSQERRRPSSLSRALNNVLSVSRISFYRQTIQIGPDYAINLFEAFFVGAYIVTLFTWEFVGTRNVLTHENFDIQYWSNRAGTIAASQLPFIVALASKNNLITWVTGISYERLSYLHRMCARTVLVLVWVHFLGRYKIGLLEDVSLANTWVRCGVMTATAFTLLVILSLKPIRTNAYEIFYFSHILLAIIILLGAYFHTRSAPPGFSRFIWPAFIIWGLDRAIRLCRMLLNKGKKLPATISLASPTVVRLDVDVPGRLPWKEGQHAFLTIPGVASFPTQAHPFTIASSCCPSSNDRTMTFLIKAKKGLTRKLLEAAHSGKERVPIIVDGPYGIPPSFDQTSTVVLVAGGTGCSFMFPLLERALRIHLAGGPIQRVVFIWAVRDAECVNWMEGPLRDAINSTLSMRSVRIEIYLTRNPSMKVLSRSESSSMEVSADEKALSPIASEEFVQLINGRPNVDRILEEEIAIANRSMAVYVSGPQDLLSTTRKTLSFGSRTTTTAMNAGINVSLHVEEYGFA